MSTTIFTTSAYPMKKKWFTLLEIIIAMTSFFILLVVILTMYSKMIHLKYNIQARTNITQDTYFAIEKINLLLKDYTIDYEEYFNRKNIWCDEYNETFTRDVGENGHCDLYSTYGNHSNTTADSSTHDIYFCSSAWAETTPYTVVQDAWVSEGSGCQNTWQQSFWQYVRQFRDVRKDVDSIDGAPHDDDDENIMKWPTAIEDTSDIQELYLISQAGNARIYIRRNLIESGDWNNDGIISGDSEHLYTLEILKLKWFDAGDNHDFNVATSSWVYDGKIDTRACDYSQWFICNGSGIGDLYSNYRLPQDQNDGRTPLFQKSITISDRDISISPSKNPTYALAEDNAQIHPYLTLSITSKLYGKIRQKRLGMQNIDTYQFSLQTTFNTKDIYTK